MNAVDRIFGFLLVLGALLHGLGSYHIYHDQPMTMLWAWSGSFAMLLLAAMNLMRVSRPGDRGLAWVSLAGCLVWAAFSAGFGRLIGNLLDFRPLVNLVLSLVLAGFSLRSALRAAA